MVDERAVQIENRIRRASDGFVFQYGARGWNMDDCAAEAGITKRTLYRYRESKALVLEEVLLRFIRTVQQNLAEIITTAPDFRTGIARLSVVFPELLGKLETNAVRDIFRQYPELETEVIRQRRSLTKEVTDYVRQARDEGQICPEAEPDRVVDIVQALVLYYLKQDPRDMEINLKNGISLLLHGLLPQTP